MRDSFSKYLQWAAGVFKYVLSLLCCGLLFASADYFQGKLFPARRSPASLDESLPVTPESESTDTAGSRSLASVPAVRIPAHSSGADSAPYNASRPDEAPSGLTALSGSWEDNGVSSSPPLAQDAAASSVPTSAASRTSAAATMDTASANLGSFTGAVTMPATVSATSTSSSTSSAIYTVLTWGQGAWGASSWGP